MEGGTDSKNILPNPEALQQVGNEPDCFTGTRMVDCQSSRSGGAAVEEANKMDKPSANQSQIATLSANYNYHGEKYYFVDQNGNGERKSITDEAKGRDAFESDSVQTSEASVMDSRKIIASSNSQHVLNQSPKSVQECLEIYQRQGVADSLSDEEIIRLVHANHVPVYDLEMAVADMERGVQIRRKIIGTSLTSTASLDQLPFKNYDYSKLFGACCENVVGYVPIPVGVAGPLKLDNEYYQVPMATTEGCLVASTNRGCRALFETGVNSRVVWDGMSRGPVVSFPSAMRASEMKIWLGECKNFDLLRQSFDATSRFAKLEKVQSQIAGRYLFIRFVARTGDAMGMNMVSKGTEAALKYLQEEVFTDMRILALSGNFCSDKKSTAMNWIEGRGKSVVAEATVPGEIVEKVLKTSVSDLVEVNIAKNLVGSAIAGSIGGFNAQAVNIVTAIFIATGQDPAQSIVSGNCITLMEPSGENGQDLYISCSMPSIEVGTVGGGTNLPAQSSCLAMMGVQGASLTNPGDNASRFARIICGTVLAGELSLMSALAAGHLVSSHLRLNRSSANAGAKVTLS